MSSLQNTPSCAVLEREWRLFCSRMFSLWDWQWFSVRISPKCPGARGTNKWGIAPNVIVLLDILYTILHAIVYASAIPNIVCAFFVVWATSPLDHCLGPGGCTDLDVYGRSEDD